MRQREGTFQTSFSFGKFCLQLPKREGRNFPNRQELPKQTGTSQIDKNCPNRQVLPKWEETSSSGSDADPQPKYQFLES